MSLCVSVHMSVCACIWIYLCMRVCLCMHVSLCCSYMCIFVCLCICMHITVHLGVCVYIHAYPCVCMCACVSVCVSVYVRKCASCVYPQCVHTALSWGSHMSVPGASMPAPGVPACLSQSTSVSVLSCDTGALSGFLLPVLPGSSPGPGTWEGLGAFAFWSQSPGL